MDSSMILGPERGIGGQLIAQATARYELARAIRACVEDARESGSSPAEIRAMILDRLAVLDPSDPESVADITASVEAVLDEALEWEV